MKEKQNRSISLRPMPGNTWHFDGLIILIVLYVCILAISGLHIVGMSPQGGGY